MPTTSVSRRTLLNSTLAWAGAAVLSSRAGRALGFVNANDRPRMAIIGTGSRWSQKATGVNRNYGCAPLFTPFGDYVAVCDADQSRREMASALTKEWHGKAADIVADYRQIIDRKDIDIVHVSTPDHWHAKIAIEALRAGKDVYCEKPMTLTIEEGQKMCEVTRKTGRIVQIGTQQRSELSFLKAIALIRDGRIGEIKKATCVINGGPSSPQLPVAEPPKHLDWNLWQGPAPSKPYRYLAGENGETKSWSRSHYEFRWWYEYSGGKLTDWGAHHVDIATWAIGMDKSGPTEVIPVMAKHPVPLKNGMPTLDDAYNVASEFEIHAFFPGDIQMIIRDKPDPNGPKMPEGNGIFFEGDKGTLFVSRGSLRGEAAVALKDKPMSEDLIKKLYKGKTPGNHMANFIQCVRDRGEPVSDVHTHNRAMTTCHLANIAIRLDRKLKWDAVKEEIVGDSDANGWLKREQRKGYEINA